MRDEYAPGGPLHGWPGVHPSIEALVRPRSKDGVGGVRDEVASQDGRNPLRLR